MVTKLQPLSQLADGERLVSARLDTQQGLVLLRRQAGSDRGFLAGSGAA